MNSLTKDLLEKFGIPVYQWTAHSTRGAGVCMFKNWGLSSEEVCELGQWKNSQAFTNHYLRLGAVQKAKSGLDMMAKNVHNTSPRDCAESEWLRTPGTQDPGGSNQEGEAQEGGGPEPPRPKRRSSSSPPRQREKKGRVLSPGGPHNFTFAKPVSETTPPTPALNSQ